MSNLPLLLNFFVMIMPLLNIVCFGFQIFRSATFAQFILWMSCTSDSVMEKILIKLQKLWEPLQLKMDERNTMLCSCILVR